MKASPKLHLTKTAFDCASWTYFTCLLVLRESFSWCTFVFAWLKIRGLMFLSYRRHLMWLKFLVQREHLGINKHLKYTYVACTWILAPLVVILTCSMWDVGVSHRIPLFSFKMSYSLPSCSPDLVSICTLPCNVSPECCHFIFKCFYGTLNDSSNQFKLLMNLIASVCSVWTWSLSHLFTLADSFLVEKWSVLLAYCTCKLYY